ncbi:serine hydrolase [Pseudooceanicola sp.]|uniref:D-alanyl-D-alanine carboxypeptidase family protein n=1 Tax=Pseudooceanicola sp. TaxID=1914328 RepID=UPI0035180035
MQVRRNSSARLGVYIFTAIWFLVVLPLSAVAAPYAAYVIDARTGEVLHESNADTRLHPASLTKMMTLYIAFEAVRNGEISLDTKVRISQHAASEPPSKLGLQAGSSISLRYLIRAAAIKSANDAATAIGEAISGSEAAFARRMTRTAKALGMTRTTFKNAHGLTEEGHLSTAHDMTILGRHLIYDYPEYYNLFSRSSAHAGIKTVTSHNRLLQSYKGADGIKTGYTRAAGFNLTASAQRGNERVIATVFGGKSSTSRNAKVAELLDLGFRRAPSRAPLQKPDTPEYIGKENVFVAGAVHSSLRPKARAPQQPLLVADAVEAVIESVGDTVPVTETVAEAVADTATTLTASTSETVQAAVEATVAEVDAAANAAPPVTAASAAIGGTEAAPSVALRPAARPTDLVLVSAVAAEPEEAGSALDDAGQEIVTRLSTSGGHHWGINVGRYGSEYQAEKVLLRTALTEMATLDGALRKVARSPRGFDANFLGMTREQADLACRRLQARNVSCFMIGPSS